MPSSSALVSQSLRMLCAQRERLRRMELKQQSVQNTIEEIRLVNRAKWLLIECLNMTEADAQRYIEKQSMDQRITKRRAAENVIKTYS
jgi:response regulator NasT